MQAQPSRTILHQPRAAGVRFPSSGLNAAATILCDRRAYFSPAVTRYRRHSSPTSARIARRICLESLGQTVIMRARPASSGVLVCPWSVSRVFGVFPWVFAANSMVFGIMDSRFSQTRQLWSRKSKTGREASHHHALEFTWHLRGVARAAGSCAMVRIKASLVQTAVGD